MKADREVPSGSLDGEQHFANPDAYRCDRRKDALLQQHGYFVLRFLACDVASVLTMCSMGTLRSSKVGRTAGGKRSHE